MMYNLSNIYLGILFIVFCNSALFSQVSLAEKNRMLEEKLSLLEIKYARTMDRVSDLENGVLKKKEKEIMGLEKKIKVLTNKRAQFEKKIDLLEAELVELKFVISSEKKEVAVFESKLQMSLEKKVALDKEVDILKSLIAKQEVDIQDKNKTINKLEQALKEQKDHNGVLGNELDKLNTGKQNIRSTNPEVVALRNDILQFLSEVSLSSQSFYQEIRAKKEKIKLLRISVGDIQDLQDLDKYLDEMARIRKVFVSAKKISELVYNPTEVAFSLNQLNSIGETFENLEVANTRKKYLGKLSNYCECNNYAFKYFNTYKAIQITEDQIELFKNRTGKGNINIYTEYPNIRRQVDLIIVDEALSENPFKKYSCP